MIHFFLTTLFSVRLPNKGLPDPLDSDRLEHRFSVFQTSCLPSVLGQTRQEFDWIIQIDPDLPDYCRSRLEALVNQRERSHVVVSTNRGARADKSLIEPLINNKCSHIVMVIVDNDDAMCKTYLDYLNRTIQQELATKTLPPLKYFGCEEAIQWDWLFTEKTPLGYWKPWIKEDVFGRTYPTATGFAICSKYPELDYQKIQVGHNIVKMICLADEDLDISGTILSVDRTISARSRIKEEVIRSPLDWDGVLHFDQHYHACTLPLPQIVVVNHNDNHIIKRLEERKESRIPVDADDTFRGVDINYRYVEEYTLSINRSIDRQK